MLCKQYYQDYVFISDFEKIFQNSRFKLFRYFHRLLGMVNLRKAILKIIPLSLDKSYFENISKADIVILAPGGYFHDYYDFEERVIVLKKILKLNQNVCIFGQSIGPIQNPSTIACFKRLKSIGVRESNSFNFLNKYFNNLHLSSDIAFDYINIPNVNPTKINSSIVVNFREWGNDTQEIIVKAISLCNYLIDEKKYILYFISTCQGIDGYVDDTKMYNVIYEKINSKNNFRVVNKHHTPDEYIKEISKYEFYIGMRLHGAIMAILCNVPSFILGYEQKSKYLMQDLNLEKQEIHYSESFVKWREVIDEFISNKDFITMQQKTAVLKAKDKNKIIRDNIHKLFH
jgi:polysaccharide pyruvyl transferase WcaK-like protein